LASSEAAVEAAVSAELVEVVTVLDTKLASLVAVAGAAKERALDARTDMFAGLPEEEASALLLEVADENKQNTSSGRPH